MKTGEEMPMRILLGIGLIILVSKLWSMYENKKMEEWFQMKYRQLSKKATREQKLRAKEQFKFLISNGNGRKRDTDDKLSSYFSLLSDMLKLWGLCQENLSENMEKTSRFYLTEDDLLSINEVIKKLWLVGNGVTIGINTDGLDFGSENYA